MKFIPLIALTLFTVVLRAQDNQPVMSGGACSSCNTVQDGSTVLGQTYVRDTCGLNYVAASLKIGQRFSPIGAAQPCTLSISGMPSCCIIERAFLWADASGNGSAVSATITNPASVTNTYPMTLIGTDVDKCWSYTQTDSYRADITGAIAGNGNYIFSGLPVGSPVDIDGIMMMIIYRDPTATYEGHIAIWDGAVVIVGGQTTQTLIMPPACANSTNQRAFMQVADLQGMGALLSMNGGAPFTITEDWWNYIDQPTSTITAGQTTSQFDISSSGDCYNFLVMGLYYQTTSCNVCTPQTAGNINLNSSGTGTCAPNSGTVTTTPSGGVAPYTYLWQPGGQTTQTVTGLPPGSYTVTVMDATGCSVSTDTVVVPPGTPLNAQFALSPYPTANFPGTLCMVDQTVGGTSWNWVINGVPSSTASSYCYTIPDTSGICVTLFVSDTNSCADSTTLCVRVLGDAIITMPNVFTPNGDHVNDSLVATWINLTSLDVEIYDRWGVLIYHWNALNGGWDGKTDSGKEATDGVYYYICTAVTTQSEVRKLSGFVHLVRGK